jgi:hypothetical protein
MSQEKAESCKRQATSHKQQAQAASVKQQAASFKQGWFESFWGEKSATNCRASLCHYVTKTQGASGKLQAPSSKHQAASHERQAL